MSAEPRATRTQKQRSDETRSAILDATVSSLLEVGFAKTTTLEVQRRAGLSRGALLHHYPSKAELMTAAVRHLAVMRGRELKGVVLPKANGESQVARAIDLLWEGFSGPLFYVAMELRNAARTDPEFCAVLAETELVVRGHIMAQFRELMGDAAAAAPGFENAIDMTLQLMIGAGMSQILHDEPARARALIDMWKAVFPKLLATQCTHEL